MRSLVLARAGTYGHMPGRSNATGNADSTGKRDSDMAENEERRRSRQRLTFRRSSGSNKQNSVIRLGMKRDMRATNVGGGVNRFR